MVNDHISAALDELRQAQEEAPLGTQMMLNDVVEELERVLSNFEGDGEYE